jgi:acyl dehydratase
MSDRSWSSPAITREGIQAWLRATGDSNPIHRDDQVAWSLGFPSIVVPSGMVSALVGWYVESRHPVQDVRSFEIRFRNAVFPGDQIVVDDSAPRAGPDQPEHEQTEWHLTARVCDRTVAEVTVTLVAVTNRRS